MLADTILKFLNGLKPPVDLPDGVEVLNPYRDPIAKKLCRAFYTKFYPDDTPRTLILGINPGRFGGGVTGIAFTDPIRLEKECGITNDLPKKAELSSDFIYRMIGTYGGPEKFYHSFYISSVSPLGFTRAGKNLNYYDIRELQEKVTPFVVACLKKQLHYPLHTDRCFCLGEGDNYKFISRLNSEHHFFERIIPLAHPRFILQYQRKKLDEYITGYVRKLQSS